MPAPRSSTLWCGPNGTATLSSGAGRMGLSQVRAVFIDAQKQRRLSLRRELAKAVIAGRVLTALDRIRGMLPASRTSSGKYHDRPRDRLPDPRRTPSATSTAPAASPNVTTAAVAAEMRRLHPQLGVKRRPAPGGEGDGTLGNGGAGLRGAPIRGNGRSTRCGAVAGCSGRARDPHPDPARRGRGGDAAAGREEALAQADALASLHDRRGGRLGRRCSSLDAGLVAALNSGAARGGGSRRTSSRSQGRVGGNPFHTGDRAADRGSLRGVDSEDQGQARYAGARRRVRARR